MRWTGDDFVEAKTDGPPVQHVGAIIETYAPWGVGLKGATDFVQGHMSSRTVPASKEGVTGWLVGRAKGIYSTYF